MLEATTLANFTRRASTPGAEHKDEPGRNLGGIGFPYKERAGPRVCILLEGGHWAWSINKKGNSGSRMRFCTGRSQMVEDMFN